MNSIAFVDIEIEPKSRNILDIGGVKDDGSFFHKSSVAEFIQFLNGTQFICGHNIFNHDIKYIVHWKDTDKKIEVKIILPELHFEKIKVEL